MLDNAIFISGAGQRIGLYLAKQFLIETEFPVVFTYRTERPGVRELLEMGALGIQVDFDDDSAIESILAVVQSQVKSLRALIHNASTWADDQQVAAQPALFSSMYRVHVELPYQLNLTLQPLLQASATATSDIVAITDSSIDIANDTHIAYVASKTAMQSMVQNFAKSYAPAIKVNAIAPGLILFNEGDSEAYKQQRLAQSAIGIEPGPEVIWQALYFLLHNPYITGTTLPVDGGRGLN